MVFLYACNKSKVLSVDRIDPMGDIEVIGTIKLKKSFVVRYKVPKINKGWHCAGANFREIDGVIYLDFIAVQNDELETVVDLPATSTKHQRC